MKRLILTLAVAMLSLGVSIPAYAANIHVPMDVHHKLRTLVNANALAAAADSNAAFTCYPDHHCDVH